MNKIAALALLLALALVGCKETPESRERAQKKLAVELCWDEQKRKSLDPATQRFVASACEHMENEYTAKYGRKP